MRLLALCLTPALLIGCDSFAPEESTSRLAHTLTTCEAPTLYDVVPQTGNESVAIEFSPGDAEGELFIMYELSYRVGNGAWVSFTVANSSGYLASADQRYPVGTETGQSVQFRARQTCWEDWAVPDEPLPTHITSAYSNSVSDFLITEVTE